jgi:hypothetical protein
VIKVGTIAGSWKWGSSTYVFLNKVLNRFNIPIEVPINQGSTFYGEFQKLCEKILINHCTILQEHFEIDGLVE